MQTDEINQAIAELVGDAPAHTAATIDRQATIGQPEQRSSILEAPGARSEVVKIEATTVDRACLGCGEVRAYHPAVGFPCCPACLHRLGTMTWDERVAIHGRRKTVEQVVAERLVRTHGPVGDRLHVPAMFERATGDADVLAWAAKPTTTLVLQGLPGRGKSYQASGAMRAILEQRQGNGYLVNCAGLGRMGRDEFRIWSSAAVLALDDFGARLTPACLASAYELIEARHGQRRPLVVTTNMTPPGIMEIDARIGSRLGGGTWVTMTGADRRLQA